MPVNAGSAFVSIVPDMTKFATGVQAGVAKTTTGIQGTVNKFSSGLTSVLSSPWTLAGLAVAGFAASTVQSFSESEQVLAQLRNAVGENTTAYEEQATALQNLTGFQDEEILSADTVLSRFQLTGDEIRKLTPLVLDYARATGGDATSAAEAIGKALLGNTRALKAIGISYTSTGDKAKDLANIQQLLADRVGGASEAFGKTFAGRVAILQAKFDDLKETIGGEIVPVLTNLVNIVSDLASAKLPDLNDAMGLLATTSALLPPPLQDAVELYERLDGLFASSEHISASQDAIEGWATQIEDGTISVEDLTKALTDQGVTQENLAAIVGRVQDAMVAEADAENAAADAAKAHADANKELMQGLPGLIGAVLNLKDAQRDLKEAQHDTSTTAAELKDKELAVVDAFLNVRGEFGGLIQDFKDGDATVGDVIGKFRDMARRAGLSKQQINDLIGVIRNYISALGDIPTSVTTQVNVQGGQQFPGSHQQLGDGGIIRRPTMALIGESGPEAVVPLDKAGFGAVTVNVYGDVTGDELVRKVRDGLLRIGRNNVTSGV